MELIVLNIGRDLGLLPTDIFSMLVIMALVSTFTATPLIRWLMRKNGAWPRRRASRPRPVRRRRRPAHYREVSDGGRHRSDSRRHVRRDPKPDALLDPFARHPGRGAEGATERPALGEMRARVLVVKAQEHRVVVTHRPERAPRPADGHDVARTCGGGPIDSQELDVVAERVPTK
jgi:hypothetical protein